MAKVSKICEERVNLLKQNSRALGAACVLVQPWTVALQAPLSEFPRQEYWSGLTFRPPRALPDPAIEPISSVSCIGRQILFL